jgi:signal transduction histidine kinase
VFSPFFRSAATAASGEPGAGLGLAIARGIAKTYGGDVELAPQGDGGAEFWLKLLAADEGAERDVGPPSSTSLRPD